MTISPADDAMNDATDIFRETIAAPSESPGHRPFVTLRALVAFAGVSALIVGAVATWHGLNASEAIVFLGILALPVLVAAGISRVGFDRFDHERSVAFVHGAVVVREESSRQSYSLRQCCWFDGWTSDDRRYRFTGERRRCLMIVLPTGRQVACGLEPETLARWGQILQDSACRRVWRRDGLPGFVYVGLSILGAITGALIGGWGAWAVTIGLAGWLGPLPWLSAMIPACAGTGFGLGCLLRFAVPDWYYRTTEDRSEILRAVLGSPILGSIFGAPFLRGHWMPGLLFGLVGAAVATIVARHLFFGTDDRLLRPTTDGDKSPLDPTGIADDSPPPPKSAPRS